MTMHSAVLLKTFKITYDRRRIAGHKRSVMYFNADRKKKLGASYPSTFPALRERKPYVTLPKGMLVLCIESFALAVGNERRSRIMILLSEVP